ncbi:MAG: hypothetical protein ACI4AX_04795 [Muribaculaceae bacterium]
MNSPTPLEQLLKLATESRQATIGLPASKNQAEKRFPLTPEVAGMLVERGFSVKIEAGAAAPIHYSDAAYSRLGATVVSRAETLRCDIVIHPAALSEADARSLRRGCLLLTFLHPEQQTLGAIHCLLDKSVTAIALDHIADDEGRRPFADILHEIDGRASIAIASSLLADAIHGKGILLGGVAGVVPCEVTIIGSDIAGCAAARSATGLGATVRMFDNDAYRLRRAINDLGPGVIASTLHPRVFESALRSADIVIGCCEGGRHSIDRSLVEVMKRGVITFDLCPQPQPMFPSMPQIDLAQASPFDNANDGSRRVCYVNAGNAVPRTAAMALGDTLLTMIDNIVACDSTVNALKLRPELRRAAYTFIGRAVNPAIAAIVGQRPVDISLLLQFT